MITDKKTAEKYFASHQGDVAEVKNPSYVYPPVEYYPLAARQKSVKTLKAALMDMDGTTTTTEVLCIYSLEMMVRRMSGLPDKAQWEGVDHNIDLPHIIGNSTTRHVEYLLNTYAELIKEEATALEFISAARLTLLQGKDMQRRAEVKQNIRKLGIESLIKDIEEQVPESHLHQRYAPAIGNLDLGMQVNLGVDIYYETYHSILEMLKSGQAAEVKKKVFGHADAQEQLVSPMPGIPFMIPLVKGWLGDEAGLLAELLFNDYEKSTAKNLPANRRKELTHDLVRMGMAFAEKPVKLGLVTSSIFFEADIVIRQVLSEMGRLIQDSPLSRERKGMILQAYNDYHRVYDAFVTASDSSEIRLKPHRDLYSIALHKTGLVPADFSGVIGFEDSQSGTVAIRAAGIGCCIAVPFAQTLSHDLSAATHLLEGGVPQAIIDHQLFIEK